MKAITERPILMSAPMVRALREGRKTQTRRAFNPQPIKVSSLDSLRHQNKGDLFIGPDVLPTHIADGKLKSNLVFAYAEERGTTHCMGAKQFCENHSPYGKPGDRLWVRETFQFVQANSDGQRSTFKSQEKFTVSDYRWIEYAATPRTDEPAPAWKPSIFMPRWASRITLEIADIRVQRVQEISEGDALAEGIEKLYVHDGGIHLNHVWMYRAFPDKPGYLHSARAAFEFLWDSINSKRGLGWDVNPFVWCISFKMVPADAAAKVREQRP